MTLDPKTGDVVIGPKRFGRSLNEPEFLSSVEGKSARNVRRTASRSYYELWTADDPGREAGAVFAFSLGGKLQRIRLKLVKAELRASISATWSKAIEDETKVFHDEWLHQQLGSPPYNFSWGRAASIVDQHGYSAVIIISYA